MRDDVTVIVTTCDGRNEMLRGRASESVCGARVVIANGGQTPADHAYADWWEAVYRVNTPYVSILHDDDWYEPAFVERMASMMDQGAGYAFCEASIRFPDGNVRPNLGLRMPSSLIDAASMERLLFALPMTVSPSCCMFRREDVLRSLLVGGIPGTPRRSVVCGPDKLLVLLPLLWRKWVGWVNEPLVNFDAGEQSTTIAAMSSPERNVELLAGYADAAAFYKLLRG